MSDAVTVKHTSTMHYVVLLLRNILDMPLTLVSLGVTEK
jgi:hypothetical protein